MGLQRIMPQAVKDKIRNSMSGRKLSDETKQKISIGMKNAWAKVPKKVDLWGTENNDNKTSDTNEKSKI